MGSFGLCDYLVKKNIPAKLLNLAVYRENERGDVLRHCLESFQPTHAGLILHWQETAEGFLRVGEQIKSFDKNIHIISGGFTAGYFGADLLKKCRFLDFVVKGDPEKPLELLLEGTEPSEVPNIMFRSSSGIRSNSMSYFIDRETLSGISFSELTYLYDYELYIEAINKKLGFPMFIGRGCEHNCRYCGGSCSAFRKHSARRAPVNRTIDAVVSDLRRIMDFTRKIYLCYENNKDYIKDLFRAIKRESLAKKFHLNYGAWRLPDEKFLELYKELFVSLGTVKPVLELSPEVFDDEGRRKIKKGGVCYSVGEMRENLRLINSRMGDDVTVSIFFSRYHDTAKTYVDMKREIKGILRLKHDLLCEGIGNAIVFYDHLSTDVASRYWEEHVKHPKDFDSLISAIQKIRTREQMGFSLDNLCVYTPETLSEKDVFRCELMIFILETFEKYFHEMLHIMFKCLDETLVDIFEEIIIEFYAKNTADVFTSLDHKELLSFVHRKIERDESLLEKIPFIEDLVDLNVKKSRAQQRVYTPKNFSQGEQTKLNSELISIHDHDYMDLQRFLKRLSNEGVSNLRTEKTVSLFLTHEILSMPHETYTATLKEFENNTSVDEYLERMKRKGLFTQSYHKGLINKLVQSGVLV